MQQRWGKKGQPIDEHGKVTRALGNPYCLLACFGSHNKERLYVTMAPGYSNRWVHKPGVVFPSFPPSIL